MPNEEPNIKYAEKSDEKADGKNTLYCSFCGKSQHEVRKLIAGATVFICDECIELCMDIIREETRGALKHADNTELSEGWDRLKHALPGHELVRERLFRMAHMLRTEDRALDDRGFRVLLAGVKGSGLPAAIAAIWREFDLPLVRYDAARLRGRKILNDAEMFLRLVEQCEYNLERASRGAIVIENIDRLFERNQADRIVQEELELLLAGTTESVLPRGGRKHPQQEFLQLDTSGITFIATTSKLHANDPPIVSGDELPSLRFGKDRAKLSAALVGQGALPTLIDRFDEILEYLPYTTAQIETWLASPDAAPHLDAFKHEDGILPDDLRRALIDAACNRGAGFDGLISILRLVKLRRSFTGPDGSVPEPIDPAWLAKSI